MPRQQKLCAAFRQHRGPFALNPGKQGRLIHPGPGALRLSTHWIRTEQLAGKFVQERPASARIRVHPETRQHSCLKLSLVAEQPLVGTVDRLGKRGERFAFPGNQQRGIGELPPAPGFRERMNGERFHPDQRGRLLSGRRLQLGQNSRHNGRGAARFFSGRNKQGERIGRLQYSAVSRVLFGFEEGLRRDEIHPLRRQPIPFAGRPGRPANSRDGRSPPIKIGNRLQNLPG